MNGPLSAYGEVIYHLALAVLGAALLISVVTDLRSRLIYNWVTGPAFLIELLLVWLAAGLFGLGESGIGLLICAGPLAAGWAWGELRGKTVFGLGDVKLIAIVGVVVGAAEGWYGSLKALVEISIAGGLLAAVPWAIALARKREKPEYVPYGIAIAAGTLYWALRS